MKMNSLATHLEIIVNVLLGEQIFPILRFLGIRSCALFVILLKLAVLILQLVPPRHRGVFTQNGANLLHHPQRRASEGAQNEHTGPAEALIAHGIGIFGGDGVD